MSAREPALVMPCLREMENDESGENEGVTRVRARDKPDGADLPRFNQR